MKQGFLFLLAIVGLATPARAELVPNVPSIAFTDAFAGRQLLLTNGGNDQTRAAKYVSVSPAVAAVDDHGYVRPTGNGKTSIQVQLGSAKLEIPVTVTGFGDGRAIDFRTEVMPLMSKLGCNAGGCHGKASGQNGFKLSLFGFDTLFDYDAITKEARGRRIFPASPDQSMFLLKAAGQVPHGGGKKLNRDGNDYRIIRQWIAAGAPASAPSVPQVVKLKINPTDRVLQPGQSQQLAVIAEYSDGTSRDVTRQSEFFTNLDVVARVDHEGLVEAGVQRGEAAIMARHMGYVAVFRAMVPHGPALTEIPEFKPANYVDELALAKWKKLGLKPSPVVNDATFLRRVTIDVCGRLPTAEEAKTFLADNSADKRAKLIDRLLDSRDYPAFFAMRWGSILRNSNLAGSTNAAYAFHNWIKDMIARNRPYDEFVRGVVAAAGEWQDSPAINWYWQNRDDQLHQTTADAAQIFLGVRLQCAKCHHHPYERWGQGDYYGLAGFFARLGRKNFGEPPPYYASATVTTGEKNPLTGKAPEPKFLDGDAPKFSPEEDPRHALVDWMTKPENPFFAKAMVNRLWGHLLGRGIYHEVDDLRETNPPSNPELLEALAKDFMKNKFDVKHLIRIIVNSRVYQLSSEPTEFNKHDMQNFARYYARRMYSEVFFDAVNQVTGNRANFSGMSQTSRAVDLPHEGFGSTFLDTFDRPKRVTVCECERSPGATLAQVLLLSNSDEIEGKISSGEGRLTKLTKAKTPAKDVIEEYYLAALGRKPTEFELKRNLAHIAGAKNEQQGLEDVVWAILNGKEFMFNH
ncbi:DUF1549 domain-containing protein [Zavarzinella formosa]|uniref:DUF1549 domain-containing protein n=1 Tax=Zavarzinella formosa TaxID=360055 RepID=UPI00031FBA51|nr:DUF1549 domain-containing protein [Zavarzinella formosa]